MSKFLHGKRLRPGFAPRLARAVERRFSILLGFYLTGAVAGSIVGACFPPEGYGDLTLAIPDGFLQALWSAGQYFLILLALSTSYAGVVAVPWVVLLRGYLLSCSVAALYMAGGLSGWFRLFFVLGVPALLCTPCFLLAASDAVSASLELFSLRFGGASGPFRGFRARRGILFFLIVACSAGYSAYLLPWLLAHLAGN